MQKTSKYIQMTDGTEVYTVLYRPENEIIGHIHILHGMAEHIGRYEPFAEFLTNIGYMVSGHDHRGHGLTAKTDENYGYFTDSNGFETVVEDVREVIRSVRDELDVPKTILFGHSMGSFIARRYIQKYGNSIEKVILMGTGGPLNSAEKLGIYAAKLSAKRNGKKTPSPFLNKLTFGKFNAAFTDARSEFDWLSRDEEQVKKYLDDPACGFIASNQFFVDLMSGLVTIHDREEISKIPKELPILLISGQDDPVGKNGQAVWKVAEQYKKAQIEHVTVVLLPEHRHELLNEKNKEAVYETIAKWIESNE